MIDATGVIVVELRDNAGVRAIVGQHAGVWKVRGEDPAAGWEPPFVTVTWLTAAPNLGGDPGTRDLGIQEVFLSVKCYGTTPAQAVQLYGAVSDAIHQKRARVGTSGRLVYMTVDEGGSASVDPADRPVVDTTVVVIAAAQAVA